MTGVLGCARASPSPIIAAPQPELQGLLNDPECRSERSATVGQHVQKVWVEALTVLD